MTGREWILSGVVQGVGMRPAVWRLATRIGLKGRVHTLRAMESEAKASSPR